MTRGSQAMLTAFLAVVAIGITGSEASGADYKIDPVHSFLIFKVKHNDISYLHGRFNKIEGVIKTDRARDPKKFDFNVEVNARSADTGDRQRDRKLKGSEFLNTTAQTKITFQGKSGKELEENRYEVTGTLSLLGKKKEVTLVFDLLGAKMVEKSEYRMGGEATFTIKRSDFGMSNMIPEMGDEVTITVGIEASSEVITAG